MSDKRFLYTNRRWMSSPFDDERKELQYHAVMVGSTGTNTRGLSRELAYLAHAYWLGGCLFKNCGCPAGISCSCLGMTLIFNELIVAGFKSSKKLKVYLLDSSLSEEQKRSFVNSDWKVTL